ncbi:MAG TPA: cupin domain-containing protein [Gammaproteobacteria bacterium]
MEQPTQENPLAFAASSASLKWGPCPEIFPTGCEIAVLHGDPARENADLFFKVPANYKIPNHWHTSAERMVLVSGKMTVQYEGHEPVTLKKGVYAYGPPKLPHATTCLKGEECVLFIAFEEPVDAHLAE